MVVGFAPLKRPQSPGRGGDERFSLHYVVSGTIRYRDSTGQPHDLQGGDFFQFLPGRPHGRYPDASEDFLETVFILDNATYRSAVNMNVLDAELEVGSAGLDAALVSRFEHLLARLERREPLADEPWPLADALAFAGQLYARNRRGRRVQDGLVRRACRLLSTGLDRPLEMTDVAEVLDVDYDVFRKEFRDAVGLAPGEYRIARRLEEASRLLAGGLSVSATARRLGYCDAFAFSRQFKRHVGLSPSAYRSQTAPV
jgi:AraC-like DNA-binding protein